MIFLILVPWVLTTIILFGILVLKGQKPQEKDDDEFDMEDEFREIVKVAVYEEKAYWVYNNVLYEAEVTREPDFETARPIDTMTLTSKEMTDLFEILDELEIHEKE